jgi:hypothetical protein
MSWDANLLIFKKLCASVKARREPARHPVDLDQPEDIPRPFNQFRLPLTACGF